MRLSTRQRQILATFRIRHSCPSPQPPTSPRTLTHTDSDPPFAARTGLRKMGLAPSGWYSTISGGAKKHRLLDNVPAIYDDGAIAREITSADKVSVGQSKTRKKERLMSRLQLICSWIVLGIAFTVLSFVAVARPDSRGRLLQQPDSRIRHGRHVPPHGGRFVLFAVERSRRHGLRQRQRSLRDQPKYRRRFCDTTGRPASI